jgi:hypothetical protein
MRPGKVSACPDAKDDWMGGKTRSVPAASFAMLPVKLCVGFRA